MSGSNLAKIDRRQKGPVRIISGRISVSGGTPAIVQGGGFTIADTAAGKVTITFTKPGKNLIACLACPVENTDATGYSCKIMGSPSASSIVVGVYVADGTDGALVDNIGFSFMAHLQD